MKRRERIIELSELKKEINMETNGTREDGAFFDLIYNEKDNSINITFFNDWHFVQDVVIELDK